MALQSVSGLAFLLATLGMLAEARVQFEPSVRAVRESMASAKVCVRADSGDVNVTVGILIMDGTAIGGKDFKKIQYDELLIEFSNGQSLTQCVTIELIDDNQPELTETFTLHTVVATGGNLADTSTTATTATTEVSIIDDDHLECAHDAYIIMNDITELTVCVVPVLVCLQDNCTDVKVLAGITTNHSIEVPMFIEEDTRLLECATIMFLSPIQSSEFRITFVKYDIFGNSSDNTEATCRVRVISPSEEFIFEHELYFIQEGEHLELCGFLADHGFTEIASLTANFSQANGDTVGSITLNANNTGSYIYTDGKSEINATKYCGSALVITNNNQSERTRRFSVELSDTGPPLSGSSELFVADDDGPDVECFTISDDSSPEFMLIDFFSIESCFQNLPGDVLSNVMRCYFDGRTDCTHWKYPEYKFITKNPQTLQNYLPSLCPQTLQFELLQFLYPKPPSPECSAQCIAFTQTDPPSCPGSVLLLDQVFAPTALKLDGTEIHLESCQFDQNITLRIRCCALQSFVSSTCTDLPVTTASPDPPSADPPTSPAPSADPPASPDPPSADPPASPAPSADPPASPAPSADSPVSLEAIIGSAAGGAVVLVLSIVILLVAILCCCRHRGKHSTVDVVEASTTAMENPSYQPTFEPGPEYEEIQHRQRGNVDHYAKWRQAFASVIINPLQLKMQEILGEGAFGQVYKGSLISSQDDVSTHVAIKSLKDSPTEKEIDNFIAESAIMLDFNHSNVMRLVGVCFDTEDGLPLIVLPYMVNGDLKTFLRTKRSGNDGSTLTGSVDQFPPGLTDAILIGMCLDIAKGMEYLSRSKFVHRDLAARNCMVDEKLQVCVADFGLSKDVYSSDYYRLTHAAPLPVKWMAPESLYDNVYNEKTDVWSFGIVCWEVFSLGRVPFPGVDNADIPDYISRGHRLRQPSLCPNEMNTLMQSTWQESPEERPTFLQLVYSLANVLGQDITHEYFVLEGPQRETVEAGYDAVTLSNKPNGASTNGFHSLTPEEYEVPVLSQTPTPSNHTTMPPLASTVPEYGTVLSQGDTESPELHDREAAASSHVSNQTDPHVYHVLEQPIS